jgi:hypothetical protein
MFRKKTFLQLVFYGLVIFLGYLVFNKNTLIYEHLTNKKPTVHTLQLDIDKTNEKVSKMATQLDSMQTTMKSAGDQAAAAKASLQSIGSGNYNSIIPVRSTK